MINKRNYFKLLLTLTFCLSFIKFGYSQPEFKSSYEISLSNLALSDITFIYTKKISDFKYLEISNSFVIHRSRTDYESGKLLLTIQDPYVLYNLYRLRVGIRFFDKWNSYICPMLVFNVGYFENVRLWHYIDDKGSDYYDEDYLLSRTKYEVGAILKYGDISISKKHKRIIKNTYAGIGFKIKFMDDTIFQKWQWHKPVPGNYPIHETNIKIVPTLHFGIVFGTTK